MLCPDPSWPIHKTITTKVGFKQENYRYYNPKTKSLDFVGMQEDLDKAPNDSIVVLHVCAHNPTGVDLNNEQWQDLLKLVKRKNHFICFDSAY